jgi:hypothetical protein
VYEPIRALEQVGVLSWVNHIKRVREYDRGARDAMQRRCAEPGRRQPFQSAGPWRGSPARSRRSAGQQGAISDPSTPASWSSTGGL